ncbi:3-hydroxyacyl-ACP dehydratase FabZ family protein, partial [Micromonospora craterilacus]|uniref:3-hydroxyacyl-ACP dehydratase FabZ family protein n=1 Tax=Micromonospora craterilacus TaxID=1655439 RepID=UPI001F41B9B8
GRPCPPGAAPLAAVDDLQVSAEGGRVEVIAGVPVRLDDPNLCGHFPGFPVFPGVFIVEALVQAVDIALRGAGRPRLRLRAVDAVRFLAPLLPPDRLTLDIVAVADGPERWAVTASGSRDDGTVTVTLRARFDGSDPADRPDGGIATPAGLVPTPAGSARPSSGGLGQHQIRALLPQRFPLLLVDRVLTMTPGTHIEAVKAVTATEPCYRDLTDDAPPGDYAYPASLLVESLGQTAALLWLAEADGPVGDDQVLMFVGARDFVFDSAAYPGDVLRHTVHLERVIADTAFATGETYVGDRRIARVGTLMAARRPRTALAAPAPVGAATATPPGAGVSTAREPSRRGAPPPPSILRWKG